MWQLSEPTSCSAAEKKEGQKRKRVWARQSKADPCLSLSAMHFRVKLWNFNLVEFMASIVV